MRTLVTGGAGFIGSHLVDALLSDGHAVTVIDDLSRGRPEHVDAAAEFTQLDMTDSQLLPVIAAAAPEVVFHQAAQIDVRDSVRDPLHDAEVNVLGTVNLLHACAQAVRELALRADRDEVARHFLGELDTEVVEAFFVGDDIELEGGGAGDRGAVAVDLVALTFESRSAQTSMTLDSVRASAAARLVATMLAPLPGAAPVTRMTWLPWPSVAVKCFVPRA